MSVAAEWSTERATSETSKQRTKWSKGRKEERKEERRKDEGKGKKELLLGSGVMSSVRLFLSHSNEPRPVLVSMFLTIYSLRT